MPRSRRAGKKAVEPVRRANKKTVEAVRRAVAGTLNRELDVAVEWLGDGRWAVTLLKGEACSAPIGIEPWEMEAMRQVPLVPAHKRGIFLRHYTLLTERS